MQISHLQILGVDLLGFVIEPAHSSVQFQTASMSSWTPDHSFNLVTCVHGLHYVGDKLSTLTRAASWLTSHHWRGGLHGDPFLSGHRRQTWYGIPSCPDRTRSGASLVAGHRIT
jgi:hypothetical protein